MSVDINYQSLDIKAIGTTVTVPDHSLAKLMYYLSCVSSVIECDDDSRLTDYRNYYLLTRQEEQTVLSLVALFNPKIMTSLSLFILNPDLVPYGSSNEFYQITDQKIGVHVDSEVVIGGKVIKVLKIMACTQSWIIKNYYDPIQQYSSPPALPAQPAVPNYYYVPNNYNNGCSPRCKTTVVIIVVVVIIISFISYYSGR